MTSAQPSTGASAALHFGSTSACAEVRAHADPLALMGRGGPQFLATVGTLAEGETLYGTPPHRVSIAGLFDTGPFRQSLAHLGH